MQLLPIFLILLHIIDRVCSFRDYPANYTESLAPDRPRHDKTCNCTIYEKSLRNVLTRKKRGFVFFPGTVVVLTNVAAKAIIAPTPRGLIQSNEMDLFYDVPLYVQGWRKPIDDFVKSMRAEKKTYEVQDKEDEKLKNVGVVNASAIPLDEYYRMPSIRPSWSQYPLHYQSNRKSMWNPNRRNHQGGYRLPYNRGSSRYYYPNSQRRNYVQSRPQERYYPSKRYQQSSPDNSYQYDSRNQGKRSNDEEIPSWHHHREYRERRGIYEHIDSFGRMLGKSLRKCILRAICEMKEEMMPQGYSFINDVARILFTVPTDHNSKDDEFTQMALEENVDCARRFMLSCPHSPMQYFFDNFRASDRRKQKEPTPEDIVNSIIYA